jgi:phytoene dehydrogenase-like protein
MINSGELTPVDVAVIGAGMAGLSTAAYARLSGLSARVFERHSIPGGLCTAWKRKGYVFDYCIYYFMGSGKNQGFYRLWKELGIIDATSFRRIDSYGRYLGSDGRIFDLYTDYGRLRDHMLAIGPEDAKKINEFCEAIHKSRRFLLSEFSLSLEGLSRLARSLPALLVMKKWSGISVREWCAGLKSPLLREAIPALIGADIPMAGPILVFSMMNEGNAAYPLGGSLRMMKAVEARAKDLGAEFIYRAGVKRVIVDGEKAIGIELDDGRVQMARHVVAACDARETFDSLLQGRIHDPDYESLFEKREIYSAIVQVSLGLRFDPSWGLQEMPQNLCFPLMEPIVVDGRERERIGLYQYIHDPGMASEGGTVMRVQYDADYDRWKALLTDRVAYEAEKVRILEETIRALERPFPGIGKRVEASDVATPTSCERYTGNWRGSTQGWLMTAEWMKKMIAGKKLPKTFSGLSGFYLAGQWSEPGGGLPPSARNGRDVVRAIMRAVGKKSS